MSIPKHKNFNVSVSGCIGNLKGYSDKFCHLLERMGYATATIVEHRDSRVFDGETTSLTIQVFKDGKNILTRKFYTQGYGGNVYSWKELKMSMLHDLGYEAGKLDNVNIWAASAA